MGQSNYDRITKALDLLKSGLTPFVERELQTAYGEKWRKQAKSLLADSRLRIEDGDLDAAALLVIMDREWKDIFRQTLSKAERSIVNELVEIRNAWAHQKTFSSDDTDRALDSIQRLLTSVSAAKEADEVGKMKTELRRNVFQEQARNETRKLASAAVEGQPAAGLKPWREVVTPHKDVASGRFQQAEFAADLWQVFVGEAESEYQDAVQFFRRTYLTDGLNNLLMNALRRLAGKGGDPVIKLQTNFGGGKTHSMLALYHLFSGRKPADLPGLEEVFQQAEVEKLPDVHRVVLVGNKISPGSPSRKPDGTVVRTLWGELAWQLGGKEGYAMVKEDDEKATNPGDTLRKLFNKFSPCLILIDEWVAYARQLHDNKDLPAGDFETHFTFAQALAEAARTSKNALLVVSIPASDDANTQNGEISDLEVGGTRGREALKKLENIIGRIETSWRSASARESFEIVRRRLFQPINDPKLFIARDTVAKAFADMYRTQRTEFPSDVSEGAYEEEIKDAYPIHPEIFRRLNDDWATLVTFQRTRGVLRLMAAVIHSLWEREEKSLLIMPGSIPIDDRAVQSELTRYLPPTWPPVINKDVDGPDSLSLQIDREKSNLGRYSATRRVARTIYLGSAPTFDAANKGIEDSRIKLGCAQPGEAVAVFGDALRYLSENATYLYVDKRRYWFSTQPTVNRLAEDRSKGYSEDDVFEEIKRRLRDEQNSRGDFARIYPAPLSHADVPDELTARLVILGPEHSHTSKEDNSPARQTSAQFLQSRGTSPRRYANTLVFLAPDRARLEDLQKAIRIYLAWKSIDKEKEALNLDNFQSIQAHTNHERSDDTVQSRIPECYFWLLTPVQPNPQEPIQWQEIRLQNSDNSSLSIRAAKKLKGGSMLIPEWAPVLLRQELDKIPLWRGNHVSIKQLVEDFASYIYLSRLSNPSVLIEAIRDGLELLTWEQDSFAYAADYDEKNNRYRGLRCRQQIFLSEDDPIGFLIKPSVAAAQYAAEIKDVKSCGEIICKDISVSSSSSFDFPTGETPTRPSKPKRFYGTVSLDPNRAGRDASKIADEIISHIAGLSDSEVKVTLEINASISSGVPDNVVRTVTENCRTLKFTSQGFEKE